MKKWMFTIMLCLLLAGGARAADPNQSMTFWAIGGVDIDSQNNEIEVRLGYRVDNKEIGLDGLWRLFTESDTEPTDKEQESEFALGIYGALHFPKIIDVNNFIPVSWLPGKILSEPYMGAFFLKDIKGKGASIGPMAGLKFYEFIGFEYRYQGFNGIDVPDDHRFLLCICRPF